MSNPSDKFKLIDLISGYVAAVQWKGLTRTSCIKLKGVLLAICMRAQACKDIFSVKALFFFFQINMVNKKCIQAGSWKRKPDDWHKTKAPQLSHALRVQMISESAAWLPAQHFIQAAQRATFGSQMSAACWENKHAQEKKKHRCGSRC